MAKRNEAVALLRGGRYLEEIASDMAISFQTVVRYMKLQVAEGALKISDVYFSLRPSRRDALERLLSATGGADSKQYYRAAESHGFSWDEANLYWSLRENRISRGDMYEHIADLEVELHRFVRQVLEHEFGSTSDDWWRRGVPLSVRKSCVQAREEDAEPLADLFAYTTFINLAEILEKNWALFCGRVPPAWSKDRKNLLADLKRLNTIRNAVMHPVKDRRWDEGDFTFVKNVLGQAATLTGHSPGGTKALRQSVRFKHRK